MIFDKLKPVNVVNFQQVNNTKSVIYIFLGSKLINNYGSSWITLNCFKKQMSIYTVYY